MNTKEYKRIVTATHKGIALKAKKEVFDDIERLYKKIGLMESKHYYDYLKLKKKHLKVKEK